MPRRLPNYLKTYRKQSGFSQVEMAFLLGCLSGAKVSRYEQFKREPDLRSAFICQVIFGIPMQELFPGLFSQVEQLAKERARLLFRKLERSPSTPLTQKKRDKLSDIASGNEVNPQQVL